MRILVAGSRNFTDKTLMGLEMSRWVNQEDVTIVTGGALGADSIAGEWAKALGYKSEVHAAEWKKHHKAAGIIRNRAMVDSGVDRVLIFYGPLGETAGSKYTEEYARGKGVPVEVFFQEGDS